MAKKTLKIKKGKKKWFTVLAPAMFNSIEIGEITAYEPDELIGRQIEINSKEISTPSRDRRDQRGTQKVVLRVTKVQGEKASTEIIRSFMLDSFAQRVSRRFCERFISVITLKAKDSSLKFKILFLFQKKISNKVRANILAQSHKELAAYTAKIESSSIFAAGTQSKLASNLKKSLKKIYPVDQVLIWKVGRV